ncbi:hypothetical protein ACHAPU_011374 [Fusarium lateritium]
MAHLPESLDASGGRHKLQPGLDFDYGIEPRIHLDNIYEQHRYIVTDPFPFYQTRMDRFMKSLLNRSRFKATSKPGHKTNESGEQISDSTYWKNLIYKEMAWIVEFLPPNSKRKFRISWEKIYHHLDAISKGQGVGNDKDMLEVLQNRSRIWKVCAQVLQECPSIALQKQNTPKQNPKAKGKKAPADSSMSLSEEHEKILQGAISSPMPFLTFPHETNTIYASVNLVDTIEGLQMAEPMIRVYWTSDGELAGIGVHCPKTSTTKEIGSKEIFHSSEDIPIPFNNWVSGIVITSKEFSQPGSQALQRKVFGIRFEFYQGNKTQLGESEGDHQVLIPKAEHIVVAFSASWAPGKPLDKLALLQQHEDKIARVALCRFEWDEPGTESYERGRLGWFYPNAQIMNCLWKGVIPNLRLCSSLRLTFRHLLWQNSYSLRAWLLLG